MDTKRSLYKSSLAAVCAAGTVALAGFLPGSTATAQPVTPIQHVVVIYLENHSFDNVLGYWCDANPGRCPDGGMPSSVTLSNGAVVKPSVTPDTIPAVNHSVASQLAANGGAFEPTPAAYHASILDELDTAGLAWKIYGQATPGGGPATGLSGGYSWSICPSLAECLYTNQKNNLVDNGKFFTDAAAGTLPAFSVVTSGGTADGGILSGCHNSFSMTACDNYIGQLVQAAENGPDWSSTAVFITFDDFGGFYDQVPPPVNPDFTQEGPRSPLIIISPYAKAGFTDTTPASFAGILAYTEHTFGLGALGPNDNYAYAFSNAFNYSQVPLKPARMVQRPLPASARHIHLSKQLLNDPT